MAPGLIRYWGRALPGLREGAVGSPARLAQLWPDETYCAAQAATAPPAPVRVAAPPSLPSGDAATLAAELHQAQWQLQALELLIDQAEVRYHIDIRKKGGAKPSK